MRLILALVIAVSLAPAARAQDGWGDLGTLLAQSLGQGADATQWFPDSVDPAQATEAIGTAYIPFVGGNARSRENGYFRKVNGSFQFAGRITELFGVGGSQTAFFPDRIEITTTMLGPGEPRCCPTLQVRWAIDRTTLVARRLN